MNQLDILKTSSVDAEKKPLRFSFYFCGNNSGIAIEFSFCRKPKKFTHSLPKPFLPPTLDSDDPDSNKNM